MKNLPPHVSSAFLDKTYSAYRSYLMVSTQSDPMKSAHLDLTPLYPDTQDLNVLRAQVDDVTYSPKMGMNAIPEKATISFSALRRFFMGKHRLRCLDQ